MLPALLACVLLLAACTVQLAPPFDTGIIDGLAAANEEAMTLFATVSGGVSRTNFTDREKTYNAVIGKFDALRLQAGSRPVSTPLAARALGSATDIKPDQVLKVPTPDVLAGIVRQLTRMRDEDRAQGLVPDRVDSFKESFEIRMQQALVYEKALQR